MLDRSDYPVTKAPAPPPLDDETGAPLTDTVDDIHSEDISSALGFLGLSEPEILIYKTLLELGSRPAGMIAQRAGLKRGHTYNILALLASKGIVQEFMKNNVRHFTCSAPRSLVSVMESREEQFARQKSNLLKVIPFLEQLRSPVASQPRVRFYQGVEGVKEILEDMIRSPDETVYSAMDIAYSWRIPGREIHDWTDSFMKRRIDRNVWYYGIINESPESDFVVGKGVGDHSKRYIKKVKNIYLPVEINIYGNKVAVITTHEETLGLIIENRIIAETCRGIFKAIWDALPNYEVQAPTE